MATTKFTPGAWAATCTDGWQVFGPKEGEWVCDCGVGGNSEDCARLIAAAPLMYEALERIYQDQGWAWVGEVLAKAVKP